MIVACGSLYISWTGRRMMFHLFPFLSLFSLPPPPPPPPPPGHQEKPNILCFHPQASSLLASAGFDCQLFLWDLEERAISLRMDPLPQPVRTHICQLQHVHKLAVMAIVREVLDNVPDHCDLIYYSYGRKGNPSPSSVWVTKNVMMSTVVAL